MLTINVQNIISQHGKTPPSARQSRGNESVVPKIMTNNTINLFFLNRNQHFGNFKP